MILWYYIEKKKTKKRLCSAMLNCLIHSFIHHWDGIKEINRYIEECAKKEVKQSIKEDLHDNIFNLNTTIMKQEFFFLYQSDRLFVWILINMNSTNKLLLWNSISFLYFDNLIRSSYPIKKKIVQYLKKKTFFSWFLIFNSLKF